MAKDIFIPFDDNGNLIPYVFGYVPDSEGDGWRRNFEFQDIMRVESMSRGCSAAHFSIVSETSGSKYQMFMRDILDMVKGASIEKVV